MPEATRSSVVPDQDVVSTYGIRSIIGFGGLLPCGAFFVAILFTTVTIPKSSGGLFKTLMQGVRLALLPNRHDNPHEACETIRADSLDQLLHVHEQTVLEQADHLQHSLERLEDHQAQLRLLTSRLQTAQDEERRRIGHELHDDIASRLGSAIFDLEVYTKIPSLSHEQICSSVQDVRTQLKEISLAVRDLARTLQPSLLEMIGLSSALVQHVEAFRTRTGINASLVLTAFNDHPDHMLQTCLFRVVQEGLHNVWKHAPKADVVITLRNEANAVVMTIADTGPGFDLEAARQRHQGLGLLNMEERVRLAQGTFVIQATAGQGTQIHVTLPVSAWTSEP
jgi:signal transduction histidine kinase